MSFKTLKKKFSLDSLDIVHTNTLKISSQFNKNFDDGSKNYVKIVAIIGAQIIILSITTPPAH